MILPAGSNAVQFEVKRNCTGSQVGNLPVVIWVNRFPIDKSDDLLPCENNKPSFEVVDCPAHWKSPTPDAEGMKVCACMGDFVE